MYLYTNNIIKLAFLWVMTGDFGRYRGEIQGNGWPARYMVVVPGDILVVGMGISPVVSSKVVCNGGAWDISRWCVQSYYMFFYF